MTNGKKTPKCKNHLIIAYKKRQLLARLAWVKYYEHDHYHHEMFLVLLYLNLTICFDHFVMG